MRRDGSSWVKGKRLFTLVIVDDERIIREGLRDLVDWRSLGVSVVGTASSVREAIEVLAKTTPDIVLTDIVMPGVNGIELIRLALERGLSAEFVIVTAHQEFDYARDALRLGVSDYIIKPYTDEELAETIARVTDRLTIERRADAVPDIGDEPLSKVIRDAESYIRDHYAQPITAREIADAVMLSPNYLCQKFRKETGLTIKDYLTQVRIDAAKKLLRDSYDLVYQVAERVGYSDPKYFSQLFHTRTGMHPQQYRDESQ